MKSKELKSFLRIFETENQFWVFQHLSEADIDQLIKREHPVKQSGEIFNKKICMNCGLPTRCYTYPLKCKAKKSNYSKCQKSRKYSKTKREKFKLKIRRLKQESNCQTLRNFLKSNNYKLTSELIPYDALLQKADYKKNKKKIKVKKTM